MVYLQSRGRLKTGLCMPYLSISQNKLVAASAVFLVLSAIGDGFLVEAKKLGGSSSSQSFLREPFDQIAIVGEHVTLPCRVVGKKGVLQWTRDDFGLGSERELTGFERYKMTGSDEEGKKNSPLFIFDNFQNPFLLFISIILSLKFDCVWDETYFLKLDIESSLTQD